MHLKAERVRNGTVEVIKYTAHVGHIQVAHPSGAEYNHDNFTNRNHYTQDENIMKLNQVTEKAQVIELREHEKDSHTRPGQKKKKDFKTSTNLKSKRQEIHFRVDCAKNQGDQTHIGRVACNQRR